MLKYPVHTVFLLPKACSAVVLCSQLFRAITRDQGHLLTTVQLLGFPDGGLRASQALYVFQFEDLSQADLIS